jgi:ATP-binding cassette, subfamily B, bacterial
LEFPQTNRDIRQVSGAGRKGGQRTVTAAERAQARLTDLELRSQLAGRWRMASLSIIFAAIPAIIYLAAGLPVTRGAVSIGTLIAFTTLQNTLFRPVTGLLNTSVSVISSLALFARIFEWLALPVDIGEPV